MSRYPWLVFIRFFATMLAFNLALFLLVFLFVFGRRLEFSPDILGLFTAFAVGQLVLSVFLSYRFTRPIQRALKKAFYIAAKKRERLSDPGEEEQDLFEGEPGEYSELEIILARLEKKLQKRKEQLTREREENSAFMSSVQEGLISVNSDGKLLYFNSQFAALFMTQEQVRSETGAALTDCIRVPIVDETFRRVLDRGVGQKIHVRLTTQHDHQARDFAISMNPLRQQKTGVIRGVIGVFHDITDLKKAERVRIEFVGNASHELRTPLTSIKGYLETLKEDFGAGHLQQIPNFLNVISKNVDRLIDLVNDLLSLSSLDHHPELQLEQVNALALSDQVVRDLAFMAAEKNHLIRVIGEVPPFWADAGKVEQVLRNLVSNAIKYIPPGKTILIRWERDFDQQTVMRVIDDGPGIPEEHHLRLFERFYRIDKGRSRDSGGTGLGLAIVKHIMQSHGGVVTVQSQIGQGAEFICTFPVLRGPPR